MILDFIRSFRLFISDVKSREHILFLITPRLPQEAKTVRSAPISPRFAEIGNAYISETNPKLQILQILLSLKIPRRSLFPQTGSAILTEATIRLSTPATIIPSRVIRPIYPTRTPQCFTEEALLLPRVLSETVRYS